MVATVANVEEAVSLSCTIYCVSSDPPLSDGASQERATSVLPEIAESDCGAEGPESVPTVIVTLDVAVAFSLVAESVYVVVTVGLTETDPDEVAI